MPALHSVAIRCESSAFLNGFYFQAARDIFGTFGSTTPSSRLTALGCGEEFAACDEPRDILGWGSEQNGVCLGNMSECGGVALFHVGKPAIGYSTTGTPSPRVFLEGISEEFLCYRFSCESLRKLDKEMFSGSTSELTATLPAAGKSFEDRPNWNMNCQSLNLRESLSKFILNLHLARGSPLGRRGWILFYF
jgi:hypothetical protein